MALDLKPAVRVPFDRLYLDPNNPRLGGARQPGYEDTAQLFGERTQRKLEARMRKTYKALKELVASIVNVGWMPVDAILVWEVPQAPGHFVVVEGNARTTALRAIREEHAREQARLHKARADKLLDPETQKELADRVARLADVIDQTAELDVVPVAAPSAAELARRLPRLLGVRHISHAQQWKPQATNVYIYSLYRQLFHETYGPEEKLRLEEALLRETGGLVSLNSWKVRKSIQAAVAFARFRAVYEDRLPKGERFQDTDQNYFLYLFEPGYAREQFGLTDADLWLAREGEEVLFAWAFAKPRAGEGENRNVFRAAEDVRLWNTVARYDDRHGTRFSRRLDVRHPDKARPVAQMDLDWSAHRAQRSPVETLLALVESLRSMEVDTLVAAKQEIRPAIDEMLTLGKEYRAMLDALEGPQPPRKRKRA
jgi:hypothetical protein